jgi:hypothetical protein
MEIVFKKKRNQAVKPTAQAVHDSVFHENRLNAPYWCFSIDLKNGLMNSLKAG